MGGVVGAMVSPLLSRKNATVVPGPAPVAAPTAKPRKPRPATVAPAAAEPAPKQPETVVPEPAPVPAVPKHALAPAKHRNPLHVAGLSEPAMPSAPKAAVAPQPAAPSAIAVEQALIAQAMKGLRQGRDARGALGLLAQYAERFPSGALASEASMLRIEALLALGRQDEALLALDGVSLASMPNRDEQLVVRGELRAGRLRWLEAKQDFDQVLRGRDLPAASDRIRRLQERALWGRASARTQIGDQAGARADLALYLRYFPAGRFAESAASLLKGVP